MFILVHIAALIWIVAAGGSSTSSGADGALGAGILCCYGTFLLAFFVPWIIGMWMLFEKAGEPGWQCLIPIYNMMVMARIAGHPESDGLLAALLMNICYIGLIWYIPICIDFARAYGKDVGFGIGMLLLPPIFAPILAFTTTGYERAGHGGGYYPKTGSRPRKRRRRVEEEDEDRPRKRRRIEEEDEDRPRKRSRADEDDDEPPRRRSRADDEDEDEDRPRRKPRRDDDL